ncbi:myosin-viia [Plakobranchus ocellatus]|uniref:Myosin-viia n=1 Tax=Plakobranchus ocellatus TaxID=259542 RepID=A0AAV3ZIR2_9GAST|nr:myosin-viia [Plakobranchus ocellatus]
MLGMNSRGIFVVDELDKLKLQIHFSEILAAVKSRHQVTLTLVGLGDVVIHTHHADDFCILINFILEGLRKRATVAIARQDVTHLDGPPDSNIVRGDPVQLSSPLPEDNMRDEDATVAVMSLKSGKRCDVPANILYMVAPYMARPPEDVMERLSHHIRKSPSSVSPSEGKRHHTLQNYAKSHFRPSGESAMSKLFNKKKEVERLWSFSKDALKKPLLKKTINREDIRKLACHCFTYILASF